ncbi:predicted protein [Naegleria gruberi]|uniref:Predicted protein n=1 Tax=Naegleria gruberi TaxID=5762 RepID=D2W2X9_NAEGR|nr:uncharacterized protein NAEGRDRAFT_54297 [Naegleria gruberi]EFC36626.1 predicted protein [Naegleria gruberi]|eukprot:XP_002669370.1 predicted protein [Naegleria gruberi strain NEG-M]
MAHLLEAHHPLKFFHGSKREYEYLLKHYVNEGGNEEDFERALSQSSTIYVENLSFYTKEEQIYELFEKCGEVKRVVMGLNRNTLTPCGFCFVEFYHRSDAEECVKYCRGCKLNNRALKIAIDTGFVEGRQYGRGKDGGMKRDDYIKMLKKRGPRGGREPRGGGSMSGRRSYDNDRDSSRSSSYNNDYHRGGNNGSDHHRHSDNYSPPSPPFRDDRDRYGSSSSRPSSPYRNPRSTRDYHYSNNNNNRYQPYPPPQNNSPHYGRVDSRNNSSSYYGPTSSYGRVSDNSNQIEIPPPRSYNNNNNRGGAYYDRHQSYGNYSDRPSYGRTTNDSNKNNNQGSSRNEFESRPRDSRDYGPRH